MPRDNRCMYGTCLFLCLLCGGLWEVCCVAAVVENSGLFVSECMLCGCVGDVMDVAVLNPAFCMTCSLLMLTEDARGDHMEEAYSRAGLITALYV